MSDLIGQDVGVDLDFTPSFDFLLGTETGHQTRIAKHRAWLGSVKRERPLPKYNFKVAVYIRYYNQTKYDDYLEAHKQQFLSTIALCPNWEFIGFYIDEGANAPNMENAEAWSQLLQDCYDEKIDLIITQKASNVSRKHIELCFCARILAALTKPVGIYFISEDIYTLASYYQEDLRDPSFLPSSGGWLPSDTHPDSRGELDD